MAGGISVHAVDVASGRPAQGMWVEIWRVDPDRGSHAATKIAEGALGTDGQLDHPVTRGEGVEAGEYEVLFHIGQFFADNAGESFLTVTPFRFRIARVDEHFHLPIKFTRWGYALFRGA